MHALITRKPLDLGPPRTEEATSNPAGGIGDLVELTLGVPGLLEAADKVLKNNHPDFGAVSALLKSLQDADNSLVRWLTNWHGIRGNEHTSIPTAVPPSKSVVTCSTIPSNTLNFGSFLDATYHALCWTCLLLLRRSRLDLINLVANLLKDAALSAQQVRCLTNSISECADSLCQSIPFLGTAAKGPVCKAMALRAPLYFASQWYQTTFDHTKLAWCYEVETLTRKEVPFLQWDALLPWSLFAVMWLSS